MSSELTLILMFLFFFNAAAATIASAFFISHNCLWNFKSELQCETLPLSPGLPLCLSCSGGMECVWDSEIAFPPLPGHTLTETFKQDARGEVRER